MRREYVTLNAMRGVAALAVVMFHGVGLFGAITPRGYLAVDLFFVLSGFVIGHAYDERLAKGLSGADFIKLRLIRFWPLFALGLSIGLIREALLVAAHNAHAMRPSTLAPAFFLELLFLPLPLAQRDFDLFPVNIPSWSLFLELLVNGAYALAHRWLNTKVLVAVAVISLCGLIVLTPSTGIGDAGVRSTTLIGGCARTIFSFSIGLIVHRLRPQLARVPVMLLLLATAGALAIPFGGKIYDVAFVVLVSPPLVMLGSCVEPSGSLLKASSFLGIISFPLYAVHRPVLELAQALVNAKHLNGQLVGSLTLVGLVAGSALLATKVDPNVRLFLSNRLHARFRRDKAEEAAP
jgi:peptidoglycan/LPS O-acetylase OafA/YrhL